MHQQTQPKISVITCFLNLERYLAEAIESVLGQEYTNWELLLIDDGSTDSSTRLAKDYAAQYPGKIRYLEHEGHRNLGSSASRNVGISAASGELVAFLDGDDVWRPQLLTHLLSLLQEQQVAMVCEATEYWYSWSPHPPKKDYILQVGTTQDHTFLPPRLMTEIYPLRYNYAPCICGILVKRDLLLKYGCFDPAFTGMYDDQVLLSKFYLHEPVHIASSAYNRYRQHADSMVKTTQKAAYHQARLRYLEWLEAYLQQQNLNDPEVKKLLHQELMPYRRPMRYFIAKRLPQKGKDLFRKIKRRLGAKA